MVKVFTPIAIFLAVIFAIWMYMYAFTLIPPAAINPPEELDAAKVLWVTGTLYILAFVVLNFWLEQIWFPTPRLGGRPVPPLVGAARRGHIAFGSLEGVVFIVGVLLIGTGCSIMGTRGYGSF